MNVQPVSSSTFGKTDKEIYLEALNYTNNKAKKLPSVKLQDLILPAAVTAYIATSFAKRPGSLAAKIGGGLGEAGFWALLGGSFFGLNKISNKVAEENKGYRQFKEQQPVLHFIGSLAALMATTFGAFGLLALGKGKFAKTFPKVAEKISTKAQEFGKILDNSKLGALTERAKEAYQKFAQKHPNATEFAEKNSTMLIFLGWLASSIGLGVKANNDKTKMFEDKLKSLVIEENAKRFMA